MRSNSPTKLSRVIFFITFSSFAVGLLALTLVDAELLHIESIGLKEFIKDIGRAFIAAGLIGFFVELAEIKGFFTDLIVSLILNQEYRRQLKEDALLKHGQDVLSELVARGTNNSEHKGGEVLQPVLTDLLPLFRGDYREDFHESVDISCGNSTALKAELASTPLNGVTFPAAYNKNIYYSHATTSYTLIPAKPKVNSDFSRPLEIAFAPISGLADDQHCKAFIRVGDSPRVECVMTVNRKEGDQVVLAGKYQISLQNQLRVPIEIETFLVTCSTKTIHSYEMTMLTKGLTVSFSSRSNLYPEGAVFGLNTRAKPKVSDISYSFSQADLVLLPGHGYAISWSPL